MENHELTQKLNDEINATLTTLKLVGRIQKYYWNEDDVKANSDMAVIYLTKVLKNLNTIRLSHEKSSTQQSLQELSKEIVLLQSAFNHVEKIQKYYWNEDNIKINSGMAINYLTNVVENLRKIQTTFESSKQEVISK